MPFAHAVEHRTGYTVVSLTGDPSLGQFLSFIQLMEVETRSWPHDCGLFDLRGISTLKAVTDQVAIGQAVARHLAHMRKIASLVPSERVTGISRKEAREAGVNLMIFIDEQAAVDWLLE